MRSLIKILLLSSLSVFSQENNQFYLSEVVQVEGVSKTELFNRAEVWFSKTFNDMNAVIELKDQEAGHIYGDGGFTACVRGANKPNDFYVQYKINVFVKEGRFKYELKEFYMVVSFNNLSELQI